MKILLINNNPVVSRLTALSARKENIDIDEIQEVTELSSDGYDIVFVDSDSLTKDVNDTIKEHLKVKKSVLFYTEGEEEDKSSFDFTILKPFLPSEVSAIIHLVEEMEEKQEDNQFNSDETKTLDKEELFELNNLTELKDEPAVAETKDSFDKRLEEAFPLKIDELDDELFNEKEESIKTEEISKDKELFDLDFSDDKITLDDELFAKETPKTNEILDFESDIDELKLDDIKKEDTHLTIEDEALVVLEKDKEKVEELTEEVKENLEGRLEDNMVETKILDENEVENIKGLLSEDTNDEMTLDDLMTPTMLVESNENKDIELDKKIEEKVDKKEDKRDLSIEQDAIAKSLSTLSVEALRELLAGAEVNINIKFPEAK